MKQLLLLMSALWLLLLGGCAEPEPVVEQKALYTQVNMWYIERYTIQNLPENNSRLSMAKPLRAAHTVESTNYQRDTLIPVNSRIEIVATDSNTVFFKYNGNLIALSNIKKYSRLSLDALTQRMFGTAPVDLSKFTPEEQNACLSGHVVPGMSKEAVLVARGYPPAHKTPDLNANDWQYWNGRFNSRVYHFKEGKFVDFTD